ncbi:hypothetical protein ACOMHN_041764 [Nucella lapillus]
MANQWKHELFGCFDNPGLCVIGYCLPCYQFGKNAEAVGENCFQFGFAFLVPLLNILVASNVRGKIREQKGIQGSPASDLMAILFCPLCAVVQEAQEVEAVPGTVAIARE